MEHRPGCRFCRITGNAVRGRAAGDSDIGSRGGGDRHRRVSRSAPRDRPCLRQLRAIRGAAWLARGPRGYSDAPDPAEANAAQRCSDSARGRIDLPAFVAATIAQETGHRVGNRAVLRLPTEWRAGLDGLPGFDSDAGVLRVTDDRSLLRDQHGRSLAYLGRAHPVVRRACSRAQRTSGLAPTRA